MVNAKNIIESDKLTYEPYHQARGEGFSGQLYLATEINNPGKKYIIKSSQAHVAACEFMFYILVSKLELRAACVRLVVPSKPNEFIYPACAVDFIPNAVKLKYDEYSKIDECEILTNLSFILGDRDNLDFLRDENGLVYKIDHSDCFGIEGTAETWLNPDKKTIEYMFYQMSKPKPNIGHYAEKEILRSILEKVANFSITEFEDDFALIKKICGTPFETHFRYYINELIEQSKKLKYSS